ncbi:PQQ-binding-like beta-propeller repeat protein [Botrimarina sp.]|uniref:outer membrane protein assembly factor BamB family protein n=1 Tax=Botrimarina sp. TaxID=2795802 RepID=UPI0032F005E8
MTRPHAAAAAAALACLVIGGADWPAFRGDGSSSAPREANPPAEWSLQSGENVAWTADLPGRGVGGPIVVGDRVLLTASDGPRRERLHVLAYDASTGAPLWSRQMWATGRPNCHPTSANAAPTPCSDGQRVYVFYSSNDLAAFTLEGDLAWVRGLAQDHPGVGNDIGMASSPVVAGPAVVVQAECQGESFAIGLDRETGQTLWEVDRPRQSNWASPLPWRTDSGRPAVWLQDQGGVSLLDAATGEQITRIKADCPGVPSPAGEGARLVLAASGVSVYEGPFAPGEPPAPALQAGRLQPGSPTPVVAGDRVLVVNRGGVLACGDLASGDVVWRRRLGGSYWATPVVAGGRVYCVNDDGEASVVSLDDGEVLSEADFGQAVLASPAVGGDAIYFRGVGTLWKIARVDTATPPLPSPAPLR